MNNDITIIDDGNLSFVCVERLYLSDGYVEYLEVPYTVNGRYRFRLDVRELMHIVASISILRSGGHDCVSLADAFCNDMSLWFRITPNEP